MHENDSQRLERIRKSLQEAKQEGRQHYIKHEDVNWLITMASLEVDGHLTFFGKK